MLPLIELRLALISYQDYHILLLTLAGSAEDQVVKDLMRVQGVLSTLTASPATQPLVLGSWGKPYGTRLEIRKGGKGAVPRS